VHDLGRLTVRTMFVLVLGGVLVGLVYLTALGLLQR
jgi:hypothetical protein